MDIKKDLQLPLLKHKRSIQSEDYSSNKKGKTKQQKFPTSNILDSIT